MEQVLPKTADPESATQSSQDKKGAPLQDNSEEDDDLDLQRFDDLIQSLNELWLKKYPFSCPYSPKRMFLRSKKLFSIMPTLGVVYSNKFCLIKCFSTDFGPKVTGIPSTFVWPQSRAARRPQSWRLPCSSRLRSNKNRLVDQLLLGQNLLKNI